MMWPHIMTALITPYDERGDVNPQKAADLAQHLWGQGSGGFVVAGSTGEAFALTWDERERLFKGVRDALPPEVPVWAGTGTNDTRGTAVLTQAAEKWGADGVLVVAPYYNRPPREGLLAHFTETARHTQLPVMIYNVPGRTGVAIPADVIVEAHRLAPNIAAVKEASGSIMAIIAMHRALGDTMHLYTGDDALLLPSLAAGATGVVSVASHVAASQMDALITAYRRGKPDQALALFDAFTPLAETLFTESNPIPLKWLLNKLGWQVGSVRPPLLMLPDDRFDALWRAHWAIENSAASRGA